MLNMDMHHTINRIRAVCREKDIYDKFVFFAFIQSFQMLAVMQAETLIYDKSIN